jgi:hypothetical protein
LSGIGLFLQARAEDRLRFVALGDGDGLQPSSPQPTQAKRPMKL